MLPVSMPLDEIEKIRNNTKPYRFCCPDLLTLVKVPHIHFNALPEFDRENIWLFSLEGHNDPQTLTRPVNQGTALITSCLDNKAAYNSWEKMWNIDKAEKHRCRDEVYMVSHGWETEINFKKKNLLIKLFEASNHSLWKKSLLALLSIVIRKELWKMEFLRETFKHLNWKNVIFACLHNHIHSDSTATLHTKA